MDEEDTGNGQGDNTWTAQDALRHERDILREVEQYKDMGEIERLREDKARLEKRIEKLKQQRDSFLWMVETLQGTWSQAMEVRVRYKTAMCVLDAAMDILAEHRQRLKKRTRRR
ncbi:hypothetical protein BGW39_005729 [Mortierella sp. 14UC]|nr:hypothetical protein BGW39_005729 [Mortierella sp. 14UC]